MSLLAFLAQTVRIAVPYLFAAAGGVIAERSGVISLGLEGYMLSGAFGGTVGAYYSGSPWIGLLCGVAAGLACALIHAVVSLRFRADQVVSGIAINLLVIGLTRFLLRLAFDSSSNSPRIAGFGGGAGIASSLVRNPLIPAAVLLPLALAWIVYRTPYGLRLRAVGEHPEAAETLGVRVRRVRLIAVGLSGILASLGGVYLALDQHQFTDEMTAGRGFIALAAVIFGRWDPVRAAAACFFFAAAETLQIQLQGTQVVASQFIQMIPYVLTIVALAGVVGRAIPPAALGRAE
jgi:simple sugar transport system permease protein